MKDNTEKRRITILNYERRRRIWNWVKDYVRTLAIRIILNQKAELKHELLMEAKQLIEKLTDLLEKMQDQVDEKQLDDITSEIIAQAEENINEQLKEQTS